MKAGAAAAAAAAQTVAAAGMVLLLSQPESDMWSSTNITKHSVNCEPLMHDKYVDIRAFPFEVGCPNTARDKLCPLSCYGTQADQRPV